MFASLFPIEPDNVSLIHPRALQSVFWELCSDARDQVLENGDPSFEKEAWLSTTLFEHGACGYNIGYTPEHDGVYVQAMSTVLFCPRESAPGAADLPTAPVSDDAAIITSLFIDEFLRGGGMEAVLLDAAIMDLIERGVSAVEAFGLREDFIEDSENPLPKDVITIIRDASDIGLPMVSVLESAGFTVVADHPALPRLRMELPPPHGLLSAEDAELLLSHLKA